MATLIEIVSLIIAIVLIVLQILIIRVSLEEKELWEKCNWKILCEKGFLNQDPECELYLKTRKNVSIFRDDK